MRTLEEIKTEINRMREEEEHIFIRIKSKEYEVNKAYLDWRSQDISTKIAALKWVIT